MEILIHARHGRHIHECASRDLGLDACHGDRVVKVDPLGGQDLFETAVPFVQMLSFLVALVFFVIRKDLFDFGVIRKFSKSIISQKFAE